ncbi:Peptidyl-prolyl cis-trans isomerase CWC27 like protein [Eufriesea mexicana]|uniref:Spliceosome-associated protein CWC27 homolog n=1 Tax=Eufriesea mexicana TaxID=516756 RepID=A0A310S8P9_9HYME|nr:Peptidyl-prolyl cis-trans isomerase CWC27 like protein [Eufriesea mexicana]
MRIIEEMENEQVIIAMKETWHKRSNYNGAVAHHGLHWANKANVKRRRLTNMSNIYMQEPATKGEVTMTTTVGDIEIIQEFIAYGGDLKGTGGGRISYKITYLSTRINCCGRDDNDSQFYFVLGSTSELQNKHTIFGKVTGETIYNMLEIEETLVHENNKPLYPPRLIKTIILNNPFSNNIPRIVVQKSEGVDSSKTKTAAVK